MHTINKIRFPFNFFIFCVFTFLCQSAFSQLIGFEHLNKNSIEILENGSSKEMWFYNNGNVKEVGNIKFGKRVGKWVEFYSNGNKKSVKIYDDSGNPMGKWINYYENGNKWNASSYQNGKLNGAWIYWYKNGKKWHQLTYEKGEVKGKWCLWNDSGKLKQSGTAIASVY